MSGSLAPQLRLRLTIQLIWFFSRFSLAGPLNRPSNAV